MNPTSWGRPAQRIREDRGVGDVLCEGGLLRDRLALGCRVNAIVCDPAGLAVNMGARLRAEVPPQLLEGQVPYIADGPQAQALQTRRGLFPYPAQHRERHGVEELAHAFGQDYREAVGLAVIGSELGDEPVQTDPNRGGEADRLPDRGFCAPADGLGRTHEPLQPGDVQVRLVDRGLLNRGRNGLQRLHDLPRDPRVIFHARADEDGFRRQAARRLGNRHSRVDAVPAGLVRAGGDDASLAGLCADHDGDTPPQRMVALLDRSVEGVEVDMHDEAGQGAD